MPMFYTRPDPVFPFVSALYVYLAMTMFLFAASFTTLWECLSGHCEDGKAVKLIGCILLSIIFYRFSLFFLDVRGCRCLGVLGKFLRLTKLGESIARFVSFGLIALPIIWTLLKRVATSAKKASTVLSILLLSCVSEKNVSGASWFIEGSYSGSEKNPTNGETYTNQSSSGRYSCRLGTNSYVIKYENSSDGSTIEMLYDGISLIVLQHAISPEDRSKGVTNAPGYAYVDKGGWFIGGPRNHLPSFLFWFTYGLTPGIAASQPDDKKPLPWGQPRFNPLAYGYSWKFEAMPDGEFIRRATAIRDKRLDKKTVKEEFLRDQIAFPDRYDAKERYLRKIDELRPYIPDGLLAGNYECVSWVTNHGKIIPWESKLMWYHHDVLCSNGNNYPFPGFVGEIKGSLISYQDEDLSFKLATQHPDGIKVLDYRFKERRGNDRMYPKAAYTVKSGGVLRALDDPLLLAEKEHWLASGPKLNWSGVTRSHIFLWVLLIIVVIAPVCYPGIIKQNKRIKETSEE